MIKIGNFLFHYRNGLFPVFYLLLFISSPRIFEDYRLAVAVGLTLAIAGQALRAVTIGLAYIVRGQTLPPLYTPTHHMSPVSRLPIGHYPVFMKPSCVLASQRTFL